MIRLLQPVPGPPVLPRAERLALAVVVVVFLAVGINNIQHGAYAGQDFSFHVGCTNRLIGRPAEWFAQDLTNRPLIYWIAIDGMFLTGDRAPFAFAAYVFLLCNAAALCLLHDAMRRFIAAPILRSAAVAFIAFLPPTQITTVVFAADAMTMPFVTLLGWSLIRWLESHGERRSGAYALLAGLTLCIANLAKFTFILMPVGVVVIAAMVWRQRLVDARRVAILVALVAVAPSLVGAWLHVKAKAALADQPAWHRFSWRGTGEMTWRSLLLPKPTDVRIFDAPFYWETAVQDGAQVLPLLQSNNYTFPALLHLSTFTDVLHFSKGGNRRSGEPRGPLQQRFARWSVRTGLLFAVGCCAALIATTAQMARLIIRRETSPRNSLLIYLVLAATWFFPLTLTLPFVHHAYDWGYWLPRLFLPALWGFFLCLFAKLDETFGEKRALHTRARAVIAGAVAVQSSLHIGSVWYA